MKTTFYILGLILILSSCQFRQESKINKSIRVSELGIDSLTKYLGKDSLYQFDLKLLYTGRANNIDFSVLTQTDSTFIICQKIQNHWTITDTLKMSTLINIDKQDLNRDKCLDLIVTFNVTGSGGNSENYVFLFDNSKKLFIHNQNYDLSNIKYDSITNLIETSWYSSVVNCQTKETYIISGDSLIFNKGIEFCPPNSIKNNKQSTIEFYKMKGNKRITTKRIIGDSKKLWPKFNETFWISFKE